MLPPGGLVARVAFLHEFVQLAHVEAARACPERSVFDRSAPSFVEGLRPNGGRRTFSLFRIRFVCHRGAPMSNGPMLNFPLNLIEF